MTIDQATDTIYVADLQNGEGSGTVSVINGATCNATITTGCGQTPPTVTVGFGPFGIAFDPANRTVVVTNIEDTSVSVIDAATCNAAISYSCGLTQPRFPVGRAPTAVAVNPASGDDLRLQRRRHRLDHPSDSVKHPLTQPRLYPDRPDRLDI